MHLPSTTALKALDAIARHGSISRAAAELYLTRSAVSHQIDSLERSLGFAVLEKVGRGIALTYRGERYMLEARRALSILEEAARRNANGAVAGRLRVSCMAGFAVYWLCQHLSAFHRAYPDVELSIATPQKGDEVNARDADLFVTYGTGKWPGFTVEPITSLSFFPVCSPTLLNARGSRLRPEDLADTLLLHMSNHDDWLLWLAGAGLQAIDGRRGIVFSDAPFAQQAAISGQGIAIGDTLLSGDALARGLLVRPFDVAIESQRGYYLVCTPERAERPDVRAFSDWLHGELGASLRSWAAPVRHHP
ncbi:LysR substrate-binding domain-containing protein [Paraburkholderia pallida]|uniref:LysR family transcriptional regulator n=1 Tax=Paraburkholderia pallida TaxID=2547399 RepID=A0A4P7CXU7_9BURK|nr:LysR substrate-binding domain-containing protein [Paraburkholderia pallida]QBQ98843.1 LysR family transcriptional regulator [Paraburkholderia pallida]